MTILLEMVSDVVCPWCWLGLARVEQALDQLDGRYDVDLRFRPFELDPTIAEGGTPYAAYMEKKIGARIDDPSPANRFAAARKRLETMGAAEGLAYRFDAIALRPNTFNAHRVIHWAQQDGHGLAVKKALFQAFFADGRDVGDKDILADIAAAAGMDRDQVRQDLDSDADVDDVRSEREFFQQAGVQSVPTFLADRRLALQGAESPDMVIQFLEEAAKQAAAAQAD